MKFILLQVLLIVSLSSCKKDEVVMPVPASNELCYNGKCIQLRQGYITSLSKSPSGLIARIQVELTNGNSTAIDYIQLVFNSADSLELAAGTYPWTVSTSFEPQTIYFGLMCDATANSTGLFGPGSVTNDFTSADQGSVRITKAGTSTTLEISLLSASKPVAGSFTGVLQRQ